MNYDRGPGVGRSSEMESRIRPKDGHMDTKTLEQARRVKERLEAEILSKPGVTGIDVGYRPGTGPEGGEPVIRIYVADKQAAPELPAEVEGIPVIVIERRYELH